MPSPALYLVIATLVPLASFALLLFFGKRMGKPLAGWVATLAIGASFVLTIFAALDWAKGGSFDGRTWGMNNAPINMPIKFIPVGAGIGQDSPGFLDIGIYVDSLTILMFGMVTLVATLVHMFSLGYMAEDKRFPRFFCYLGLFCFSMLGLVIGGTILQLFIFWELVGLCSYLLIGFWYEKKSASNAAMKAFVTNRIGDFGFLIGLGILFYHLGNVTLPDVWAMLDVTRIDPSIGGIMLPGGTVISMTLLTVIGIGLFFGAVGKSAQFPLHVWLPDAMEGPTPVSALIHAATMVAAGVYLVGRIFPILTPDARLFIAIIGATTLTMAALIAIAQSDIKRVLAYSTLSQLGYMILAMGVGSWVGGLFHLITHAFFKALLFLGSGSVIYAAHHEQEMPQYGGLWKKIPITALTFGIAVLAIAGTPYLSAYYSKDMILTHAASFSLLATHEGGNTWLWLLFILPTAVAYITAFYMTRCWMLTFAGRPRNHHVHEHAHEVPVMWGPLVVLAVLSVIAGYGWAPVKGLITSSLNESSRYVQSISPGFNGFSQAWPADLPGHGEARDEGEAEEVHALTASQQIHEHGEHIMHTWVMWAPLAGILAGVLIYARGYSVANLLMKIAPLRWIHTWLYRRMYFDELYMGVLVLLTMAISRLSAAFDRYIVDGLVNMAGRTVRQLSVLSGLSDRYLIDGAVNGVAEVTQQVGAAVRAPQTGRIRLYVTVFFGVVSLGVAAAAVMVLW